MCSKSSLGDYTEEHSKISQTTLKTKCNSISKQKEVNQNLTSVMGSGSEQPIQDNKLTVLEDLRRKYLECMEKQTETNKAYEKQLEIIKRQQDSMNVRNSIDRY